jgi:hypothetical protein
MGALEVALGAGAEAARGGVQSEERRRAQAVVRQVAEALEDREEMADELDEAIARAEAAEARAEAAEAAAAAATKEARDSVKAQRVEEQEAVLSALGLAEERAVQMVRATSHRDRAVFRVVVALSFPFFSRRTHRSHLSLRSTSVVATPTDPITRLRSARRFARKRTPSRARSNTSTKRWKRCARGRRRRCRSFTVKASPRGRRTTRSS